MSDRVEIAVIGGSGLYDIEGLENVEERIIQTPFGQPSDAIRIGELAGRRVAFLARHGRGHRHNPTCVPVRANIWALKSLGVFWVVSVSAVGSLRQAIEPRHFVIPDQVIDRTRSRVGTFFSDIAVHVGFSHPFHPALTKILAQCCEAEGLRVHRGGTYICMEGPLFSTKAESELYRSWGASVIGMTAIPEAKLAREAEMCYATIALATDYDVWNETEDVSIEQVLANVQHNVENVKAVLKRVVSEIPLGQEEEIDVFRALENAVLTDPKQFPEKTRQDLGLLLDKYFKDKY